MNMKSATMYLLDLAGLAMFFIPFDYIKSTPLFIAWIFFGFFGYLVFQVMKESIFQLLVFLVSPARWFETASSHPQACSYPSSVSVPTKRLVAQPVIFVQRQTARPEYSGVEKSYLKELQGIGLIP